MSRGTVILACSLATLVACRSSRTHPTQADTKPVSVTAEDTPVRPPSSPAGQVIERRMYTLTYPTTWKLDEKDEDFDLDNYFSIDAPGNCHVSFFLYTSKESEKSHLDAQTGIMKERIFKPDPTETPFATWGALSDGTRDRLVAWRERRQLARDDPTRVARSPRGLARAPTARTGPSPIVTAPSHAPSHIAWPRRCRRPRPPPALPRRATRRSSDASRPPRPRAARPRPPGALWAPTIGGRLPSMNRIALPAALSVVLTACASAGTVDEAPPAAAQAAPAIAKIVLRDRSITLLSGHGTVRATVLDGDGRTLAKEVPIDDLQRIDATSFEATHWSVAGAMRDRDEPRIGADLR
jgi:hypothetical protein